MADTRIISANEVPPQSSSFLSPRKSLPLNDVSSSSSLSSRSSTLSTEKSSSLSTGATSSSSSLSRENSRFLNEMNQVEESDDSGMPKVLLETERISDVVAARLVTCLLGHVLYLKGQVPFPVTQLIKMSERRQLLANNYDQRKQQAQIRAHKKQDELLAAFDLLSSHLKSTFSSLSTALARNSRKFPYSSTSNVTDGKTSSFRGSTRPPAKAHVVFALGASATNVSAARSKVVMEIEGLEVKIWGERDDYTEEVDDSNYNEDASNASLPPPLSETSYSSTSVSEDDKSDVERQPSEEDNSDVSDSDDELFDTDEDESEDDSLLQDEEEEDSIISRMESLTVHVQEANIPDTDTLKHTTALHVIEYKHDEASDSTPKAALPFNTVNGILPSLSFDSVGTSNSSDFSSPCVSTSSNLSTPVHTQSASTDTDTTPTNMPQNRVPSSRNKQNDSAKNSPPYAKIPPLKRSSKVVIEAPKDDEASLRAAERLFSRTLMMANAENNGLADDIPPLKMHIFIRAPRRFDHPAWIPQINAEKALNKLVDETMKSKRDSSGSTNQQQRRRSSVKLKSRIEGVKIGCHSRVDDYNDIDESEDVRTDENDELIWWSWDGKLAGFTEL